MIWIIVPRDTRFPGEMAVFKPNMLYFPFVGYCGTVHSSLKKKEATMVLFKQCFLYKNV